MNAYDASAATMTEQKSFEPVHRLTLRSKLSDLELLWPWVEVLAAEYAPRADTLFAIHLCLEEVVSNIIRHGYHGQSGHSIVVNFEAEEVGALIFTVDDRGPAFDPLAHFAISAVPPHGSIDVLQPGGHGLRLLHKFSGSLDYKRLTDGNRLTIRFMIHS